GVDLVDEDYAGRMCLALLEEIAYAARADAHEHLHEVGAGHREEGPPRLARYGTREKRLAGTRWTHQEYTLGEPAAQPRVALRVLQELYDLLELLLRFIRAGDVGECDLGSVAGEQL